VGKLKRREAGLREQANHDPLTGLFNRRYLDDSLSRELSLAWRRNASLSRR
jgi:GGDEF domain-containing protein